VARQKIFGNKVLLAIIAVAAVIFLTSNPSIFTGGQTFGIQPTTEPEPAGEGIVFDKTIPDFTIQAPDADLDGVLDADDNCVLTPNGPSEDNQTDTNGDDVGDACTPSLVDRIVFFSNDSGSDFMDAVVGDFVPTIDGLEIATTSDFPGTGTIYVFDNQGNVITNFSDDSGFAIAAGDIDSDGFDDIVYDSAFGTIKRIEWNGTALAEVWSATPEACAVRDIEVANVNSSFAGKEVVITNECGVIETTYALRGTNGATINSVAIRGDELAIEDLTGPSSAPDGIDDVVIYGIVSSGAWLWDVNTGTPPTSISGVGASGYPVYAGSVSFTGIVQIGNGATVSSFENGSNVWNVDTGATLVDLDTVETSIGTLTVAFNIENLTAYYLSNGTFAWPGASNVAAFTPDNSRSFDLLDEGDMDGDGDNDVVFGGGGTGSESGKVFALDAVTLQDTIVFDTEEIFGGGLQIEDITVADMDADGFNDVVAVSGSSNVFGVIIYGQPADADDDGAINFDDNCALTPNANQADTNEDGVGDACTPNIVAEILHFEADEGANFMDGVVGDFDPTTDGLEIATLSEPTDTLKVFDNTGDELASFPISGRALAAGDVDNDEIDEIAYGTIDLGGGFVPASFGITAPTIEVGLLAWNGTAIASVWEVNIGAPTAAAVTDVEIANVKGDSDKEVVFTTPDITGALNNTDGSVVAETISSGGVELAIEDLTGPGSASDGTDDVVIFGLGDGLLLWDAVSDTGSAVSITTPLVAGFAVYAGFTPANFSGVIQVGNNNVGNVTSYANGSEAWSVNLGGDEIVDLDTVETESGTLTTALTSGVFTMHALNFSTGEKIWNISINGYSPGVAARSLDLLAEGDVDSDGEDEVIVVGGSPSIPGVISVLDASTGAVEMNFSILEMFAQGGSAAFIENLDLADMDSDGDLDIVVEQDGSVAVTVLFLEAPTTGSPPEGFELITEPADGGSNVTLKGATVNVTFTIPSGESVNLTGVSITSVTGKTTISGLDLPPGVTKSAQVVMPSGSTSVCVLDSVSGEISASCSGSGEVTVPCPGTASGYNCTVISDTLFGVSGLNHSSIGSFSGAAGAGPLGGPSGGGRAAIQEVPEAPAPPPEVPTIAPPAVPTKPAFFGFPSAFFFAPLVGSTSGQAVIVLILIAIAVVLGYGVRRVSQLRKARLRAPMQIEIHPAIPEIPAKIPTPATAIESYIARELARGHDEGHVRKQLRTVGWSQEAVKKAFEKAKRKSS
jgi:hypothetical protein